MALTKLDCDAVLPSELPPFAAPLLPACAGAVTLTSDPDDEDPLPLDPPFALTCIGAVAATRLCCEPAPDGFVDPVPEDPDDVDDGDEPEPWPEPLGFDPLEVSPFGDVPFDVACDAAVEPGCDGCAAEPGGCDDSPVELVAPGADGAAEPGH